MSRRIFLAGHNGMVGSAIYKLLSEKNDVVITRSRSELDLMSQRDVRDFFLKENVDEVYLAAARVGGIFANENYPADFIYDNLMIECNVIHQAFTAGVKKLLFLGSSCIYPKLAEQPISENSLLTGFLEPTNEPYAIAKIAGIKICESYNRQYGVDYRCIMPTNLYGQNDNFHHENSHVIPGMMRRFHEAKIAGVKEVLVWGSGKPRREFLHVNDMAAASVYIMNLDSETYQQHTEPVCSHINVGTGVDCTIRELAEAIKSVVGLDAKLVFDCSKPDGTLRKLLDVSRLNKLGWQAETSLESGLIETYRWYLKNIGFHRY